jgi:hypothetical protein
MVLPVSRTLTSRSRPGSGTRLRAPSRADRTWGRADRTVGRRLRLTPVPLPPTSRPHAKARFDHVPFDNVAVRGNQPTSRLLLHCPPRGSNTCFRTGTANRSQESEAASRCVPPRVHQQPVRLHATQYHLSLINPKPCTIRPVIPFLHYVEGRCN